MQSPSDLPELTQEIKDALQPHIESNYQTMKENETPEQKAAGQEAMAKMADAEALQPWQSGNKQ